jgi:MFS family permease
MTREFRLLWTGQTVSQLGTTAGRFAVPLVATTTLQASPFQIGLLTAAAWLPWLLVGIPAGTLVDRLPRRPILVACDLVSAVLMVSAPIAAWLGVLTVGQLLLVALLVGLAEVFSSTAAQVFLPSVLPPDELAPGNARLQGGASAAQVAGPGLAGLLAHLGGAVTALAFDALSYVVSAACLLRIRTRDRVVPDPGRESLLASARVGLRFVVRDPYLRVLASFGAAANLALTAYQTIIIVFLVREVGIGAGTIGLLFSLASLGGVAGAALAGPVARRFGSARGLFLLEIGAGAAALLLLPLTTQGSGLAWLVIGDAGVAAGVVAGNVINGSFRQRYCPPELLGRVTASMRVVNYGTMPLAAVLGGALATAIGLRPAMWVGTAGVLAGAMVLLIGPLTRRRDLPTAAPQTAAGTPGGGIPVRTVG